MADEYIYDEELHRRIKRLISKFPESFGHIDPDHVLPLRSDKEGYRAIAEVRRIPFWLYGVMRQRVAMIIYTERYDQLKKNARNLVDVHELNHIGEYNENSDSYKLNRHDVEDWAHMVGLLGVGWQRGTDVDIMSVDSPDWQQGLEELVKQKRRKKKSKRR